MYVLESRLTGRLLYPAFIGRVKKAYQSKLEANVEVKRLSPIVNPKRVDVVELSKSALLWLEEHYKAHQKEG